MVNVALHKVSKSFGQNAVIKGVDLEIASGEFLVLVGPSGCGKSTLLNLVAGLETPSSGEIYIGDKLVNDVPPKDRNIAMVFQSYALYPTKTVHRNMTFGMEARHVPPDEQRQALAEVAQLLHIGELLERKPGQLSGGQRQRVAMGRALVRKPDVFLFDEPLSNLDAKLRIEMRTEIKRLHQRLGKTTVYVTHDQVEAMTLASRIAVMDNGHIRQIGPPSEIYEDPSDLFVASFMGSPSMNLVRGTVADGVGGLVVRVQDEEGTVEFPLPPALAGKLTGRAGQPIDLGLRPEIITHPGAHAAGALTSRFDRSIDVVEPTGPDTMLVFTLGGQEAIGRVRSDEPVEAGRSYRFEVNMDKAKLFDPQSGVSI